MLSGEERAELERRVACYTLPHKVVQRAKMILYAADGPSNVEIADIGRRGGRRPRLFGRSEARGGIAPLDRLVRQVMTTEPHASARRVFWIVDNGSSHRGRKAVERLERRWRNLVLVHLPLHASRLNQLEIFFSIVQRKLLEPNDFENLAEIARTLNDFEHHRNEIAEPFDWNFTRNDLAH